ncbi:PAS domain S-box protein [Brevibacillus laterosporus]|nr:PAS domain S-box protein [Brevibacillus laterosporus]TPG80920.1 PAS domain S-box protein [Brevibacillus laterosporus]
MSNMKALPFFSSVSHQDILDHLPTGVIQIDSRGIIVYMNNVFLQWIGYADADTELIGRPLQEFFLTFTLADCEEETSPIERHYEINTIDNGFLYVKTLIQPYMKQGQTAHLLLIRKLGKKTKWRRIFEKFKQNHSHLFHSPDDGYMTLDVTGAFRAVNETCSVLTGYSESELLQKNIYDLLQPDYWNEAKYIYERLRTGTPFSTTLSIRHKKGHPLWIQVMFLPLLALNQMIGMYGIAKEITHEHLLEEALWESQLKYRILADYSSDLITFLDSRGKVVFVSPSHESVFGHPLQDYYQHHPFDYLHPDDIPHLRKWFYSSYESKQPNADPAEFRARHIDGHYLYIRVSCVPMLSKDGDILGFAIIGENIHDQKQTENLLRQSEKLSLIGELAAGIAHEIRNPLTALRGFTQLLQTHPEDSSKYTDIMLNELDRIHFIANELLLLAKPQGYQLAVNDICSLLQDVITLLESQAILANVTISTHWETDIPFLLCEARQLKQVFINIIKNSVEAMPTGGCIHIEVKKQEQHVLLRFSDEGCGIPMSTLEKIGKPFYTTKETGTGLGLMISSKIIREHNGTLQLLSEMNQGTTIEITLPYMLSLIKEI